MPKKPDQIIQPLQAEMLDVTDALVVSSKKLSSKKSAATLRATHKGNFQKDFGIDVDCYVLNDEGKTAVISQRGMGAAIGLATRGNSLARFAEGKAMAPYLGAGILEKIANPLKFQWESSGAGVYQPPGEYHGYDKKQPDKKPEIPALDRITDKVLTYRPTGAKRAKKKKVQESKV